VAKPYRMRELVARIGALLRRRRPLEAPVDGDRGSEPVRDGSAPGLVLAQGSAATEGEAPGARWSGAHLLQVGDVGLDADRHEVWVRGELVELPLREFQLLRELLVNAGRVVTRELLLRRVWGLDFDGDPRIVATSIGRLRARIEQGSDEPSPIVTIRGVGYRYNDRS
jgi:two-component system response regulator RegX3